MGTDRDDVKAALTGFQSVGFGHLSSEGEGFL